MKNYIYYFLEGASIPSPEDFLDSEASRIAENKEKLASTLSSGIQGAMGASNPYQAAFKAGSAALDAVDNALMGDKNFGAQSAAIDSAVDAAANLASNFGPWGAVAAAALKGGNFLTKAGGLTVQGFDVDINSSGYGSMGHEEAKSSRNFAALLPGTGLGFLNKAKMLRQLNKRNEKAMMAMKAADVADDINYELEARMGSVDDVINRNKFALAGGTDTSLLAAKKGGIIRRLQEYRTIRIAKEGAKLKNIEVSEDPIVIPEGSYHKNKHNLDLEHITEKGIPVITVEDDTVETFEEIKALEDTIKLHAEVERKEPILSKSLTEYIEELRKLYAKTKDPKICLEVGKRLTKEFLFNTNDNAGVIESLKEKME